MRRRDRSENKKEEMLQRLKKQRLNAVETKEGHQSSEMFGRLLTNVLYLNANTILGRLYCAANETISIAKECVTILRFSRISFSHVCTKSSQRNIKPAKYVPTIWR